MKKVIQENLKIFIIASLTLGLAPFNPPHILGKIKWIIGGNAFSGEHTMQLMDWWDVIMHGSPWILLLISVFLNIQAKLKK